MGEKVVIASKEQERTARDNATERVISMPLGPSISGAAARIEQEREMDAEDKKDGIVIDDGEETNLDFTKAKVREVQALHPVPEHLDPFTQALLSGVDPMAAHQALTLTYPIMAFMGCNIRVMYSEKNLRWMSGQSWQMGGSGCGKTQVLRAVEDLFLSKEKQKNADNAKKAAAHTILSEKERKETGLPTEKVRIMLGIPTAFALLLQMQVNGDGAMYISCSECGEFSKKIQSTYYSLLLDMMKQSYDGMGEAYMHKAGDKMYYAPSMKLCCNIGGTIDPMYKIFRQCDSDGTLSRGAVTMLGERKDVKKEGPYKDPDWDGEELTTLLEGAERLRNFDNTFKEVDESTVDELTSCNKKSNENDGSLQRVYEDAKGDSGLCPTAPEYYHSLQKERIRRALNVPAFIQLGKEIKEHLTLLGEISDDCCSRADERAMAMCYLLYVANGLDKIEGDESCADVYNDILSGIVNVAHWWVMSSIDCALAIQTQLNSRSRSHRDEIRLAYKEAMGASAAKSIYNDRCAAFTVFEREHQGEVVNVRFVRDNCERFQGMSLKTVHRFIVDRNWREISRGKYRVPSPERKEAENEEKN